MVTKIVSATIVSIIRMKLVNLRAKSSGDVGGLFNTGNARVPCWIVRVPREIIRGHGGLWSDNSVAMLAALFRIQFPITAAGTVAPPPLHRAPNTPDLQQ
jgi:exosome complex RNA-binding protein Rrp42 (RNase PH superfamily)